MSIINERLRSLALSQSDCAPLSKSQLDQLLSAVKRAASGSPSQEFSVADLAAEELVARLQSLDIGDEEVMVCWPAFGEGFKMKWSIFLAHLTDLWYPSSDDVVVTSPGRSWFLEITHEEDLRFHRNKRQP